MVWRNVIIRFVSWPLISSSPGRKIHQSPIRTSVGCRHLNSRILPSPLEFWQNYSAYHGRPLSTYTSSRHIIRNLCCWRLRFGVFLTLSISIWIFSQVVCLEKYFCSTRQRCLERCLKTPAGL